MEKIWKFYENMNEMVYASDMDNYELVYMNRKTLDVYGYQSFDEVRGKKCYEVLQGLDRPCDMCTNDCLRPGYFYEWKYYNPIIGKTVSLKDTMLEEDGRRYRMELAIDMTLQEEQSKTIEEMTQNTKMVNDGLKLALAEADPRQAIEVFLAYLGQALESERVYIFERKEANVHDNTFEWCAEGVIPQKDVLQDVPFEAVKLWYQTFERNKNVIIRDVEETKETDPEAYKYLKPQDIHTLVVSPIVSDNKIIGFYGVDNPPAEYLNHVSMMFKIIGHFILSLLKRRDLVKRLEKMSFYDQLTGLGNRHAMDEYFSSMKEKDSIGMLYCDVMGLKRINDTLGHQEGDKLLLRACDSLRKVFSEESLFRIGGDEFLVLCKNIPEEELLRRIEQLKKEMESANALMAIGHVWCPSWENNGDALLTAADQYMYENKRKYYEMQK